MQGLQGLLRARLQPVLRAEELMEELREGGVAKDGGHQVPRGFLGQLQEAAALCINVQAALQGDSQTPSAGLILCLGEACA